MLYDRYNTQTSAVIYTARKYRKGVDDMSRTDAYKVLGLRESDKCTKEGLLLVRECELKLLKRTLDREEKAKSRLAINAIDILLKEV